MGALTRGRRLLFAGLLLAASLAGLWGVARSAGPAPLPPVRGVLLDVRSASIIHAESVTLRGGDGQVWEFRVAPEVATNREEPQTAAHLRQHMALGEPILVRCRDTPDGPLAIRILDADIERPG